MWQHEIVTQIPLLDAEGNLTEPGWSRKPCMLYDRQAVKAPAIRRKEWDYYLIANDRYALALTVSDNGYVGLDSISWMDLEGKTETTKTPLRPLPLGRTGLPYSSEAGVVAVSGKGYGITFYHIQRDGKPARQLVFTMEKFQDGETLEGSIVLTDEPRDSMNICTPFAEKGHFYCNRKINCMVAEGEVTLGAKSFSFSPEDSFALLDWGRGVWPAKCVWYWSSASGRLDGVPFGFNLGYGFGEAHTATENAIVYDGVIHKLSHVKFHIPGKPGREDWLAPWRFTDDAGRLELDFVPILDRSARIDVKAVRTDQHQVFGRFSGRLVLDDGTELKVENLTGFAEKVVNRW